MAESELHAEQVGGGAAGYLWRHLQVALGREPTGVDALDTEAAAPGHAVYAVIDGADVLGLAVLRLPDGSGEGTVEVLGTLPGREDVRTVLVERARYDAAAAGVQGLHTIGA
jgi:hypothetical protein